MHRNACIRLLVFEALVAGVPACAPVAPPPAPATAVPAKPTVPGRPAAPGERTSNAELTVVEAVTRGDLAKVVRATISPDGRFVYVATEDKSTLSVFERSKA